MTDVDSVRADIRHASDLFEQRFAACDIARLVADYYVEEPLFSAPDAPLMRSRAQIADVLRSLATTYRECRLFQEDVRFSGDRAYELGSAKLRPREMSAPSVDCRYLIVWRMTPDGWRVETDFFAFGRLL